LLFATVLPALLLGRQRLHGAKVMPRFGASLLVLILASGSLHASLAPRPKLPLTEQKFAPLVAKLSSVPPASRKQSFEVTSRTEIFLNGKPCPYAKVPRSAEITYMEVTADKKYALKIHFRSK
jgi:hypothetical protein